MRINEYSMMNKRIKKLERDVDKSRKIALLGFVFAILSLNVN